MRRISRKFAVAMLLALIGGGTYAGSVLATPTAGVTTTIMGPNGSALSYALDQFDVKVKDAPWMIHMKTRRQSDVFLVDNKFSPGGTTGWHSHPGPSFVLVVSGTVTNYEGGGGRCQITQYSAGSAFMDEGGNGTDIHMIKDNTDQPAETIALQVLPNTNRKIDEPDPHTCPGE